VNLKVFSQPTGHLLSYFCLYRLGAATLLLTFTFLAVPTFGLARDIQWESLNLTPQQESQIHQLENNWEKTHQTVSAQIEKDMEELKTLLPTGDTQRIRQLQTRITANKMYLMNESMDTFLKKRDMLTPGQRSQLQKMIPAKGEH
jgi:Spy/CpxP family protein refolding chaperone